WVRPQVQQPSRRSQGALPARVRPADARNPGGSRKCSPWKTDAVANADGFFVIRTLDACARNRNQNTHHEPAFKTVCALPRWQRQPPPVEQSWHLVVPPDASFSRLHKVAAAPLSGHARFEQGTAIA